MGAYSSSSPGEKENWTGETKAVWVAQSRSTYSQEKSSSSLLGSIRCWWSSKYRRYFARLVKGKLINWKPNKLDAGNGVIFAWKQCIWFTNSNLVIKYPFYTSCSSHILLTPTFLSIFPQPLSSLFLLYLDFPTPRARYSGKLTYEHVDIGKEGGIKVEIAIFFSKYFQCLNTMMYSLKILTDVFKDVFRQESLMRYSIFNLFQHIYHWDGHCWENTAIWN